MLTVGVPAGLRLSLEAHSPIHGRSVGQGPGPEPSGVKVLHLIDTLEVGGAEKSLTEIVPRLRATTSIVCQLYPGSALRPALTGSGVRVISLELPGRYAFRRACRAVTDIVRRERPDLLHAALFRAGMVARVVGGLTGVPVIDSFVNDSYARERYARLRWVGRAKLRLVQALDACTARRVTRFLAISRAALHANCRALRIDERRCAVIHRGRDPAPYASLPADGRLALRRSLGADKGTDLILCVGRLLQRKGQEFLLRALPAVLARRPHALVVLAGDGPARGSYEELAAELAVAESVLFLGTRADVPALLQAADVFVFPSLYEGLGGALVEAMLAACPIVAADTPVHRESIEPGVTGLLVPPADPAALASALIALLDDRERAAALGACARGAALERFAIELVARQHDEFYREVAGR